MRSRLRSHLSRLGSALVWLALAALFAAGLAWTLPWPRISG